MTYFFRGGEFGGGCPGKKLEIMSTKNYVRNKLYVPIQREDDSTTNTSIDKKKIMVKHGVYHNSWNLLYFDYRLVVIYSHILPIQYGMWHHLVIL